MNFSWRRQISLALGGTILTTMLSVASANAADAPVLYGAPPPQYRPPPQYGPAPYAPPPPPLLPCLWLGPYVGANAGFQWTSSTGGFGSSGVTGGIHAGYNWQNGAFAYGVEADFNLSSAGGTFADYKFSNPWFGTLRGRAGYVVNNTVFLYGTAGLAFGISNVSLGGLSDTSVHAGWTIGAGAEFALAPFGFGQNWSAKVEYLYLGLSQPSVLPASVSSDFPSNVMRVGVNYHF
jgi:outer membrane immunogenic protein